MVCMSVKADHMKRGAVALITDAGGDCQLLPGNDGHAIGPRAHPENALRFQGVCIDPSQARGAAVGDQDHPVVRDNARGFRESRQCCDMLAGIVVDDLDAVTTRVRYENAAARRIESPVIKRTAGGAWYLN